VAGSAVVICYAVDDHESFAAVKSTVRIME
jgi:hypothetical protein